jgi:hypothetical protein
VLSCSSAALGIYVCIHVVCITDMLLLAFTAACCVMHAVQSADGLLTRHDALIVANGNDHVPRQACIEHVCVLVHHCH